jgi:hypothetical protein
MQISQAMIRATLSSHASCTTQSHLQFSTISPLHSLLQQYQNNTLSTNNFHYILLGLKFRRWFLYFANKSDDYTQHCGISLQHLNEM